MRTDFDIIVNENGEKTLVKCNINEGTAVIPDGVENIGKNAFFIKKIDKAIVPSSVKTFGEGAFYCCELKEIELSQGLEVIEERCFNGCEKIKSVILPQGLKRIGKGAFFCCYELKRVFIPKSVITIERDAFEGCRNLEIYCEGEPQSGWLDEADESYFCWEDITEGFNFHRSAGSFDDHYVVTKDITIKKSFNPAKRPVHTNVSYEEFLKLSQSE